MKSALLRFLAILAFFVFSFTANAQTVDAKLSFKDGSTRNVQLDNRAFHKLNSLRPSGSGQAIPLDEVQRLEVGDELYEPRRVALHHYTRPLQPSEADIEPVDTILLLRKVRGGTLQLFHFVGRTDGQHWFLEKDSLAQELVQIKVQRGNNVGTRDKYKGMFNLFTKDCPAVQPNDIEKLDFGEKAFLKIVDKYNRACGSGSIGEAAPKEKARLAFGVLAGFHHHTSTFPETLRGHDKVEGRSPCLGVYFKFPLNRVNERLALTFSPNYSFSSLSFEYDYLYFADPFEVDTVISRGRFEARYYDLPFSLRYTLPLDNSGLKPYLEGGIRLRGRQKLVENEGETFRMRRPFYETHMESEPISDRALPTYTFSYQFRAGLLYDRIELGFNYSFGKGTLTDSKSEEVLLLGFDFRYALFR